jgi:hypothetical protein
VSDMSGGSLRRREMATEMEQKAYDWWEEAHGSMNTTVDGFEATEFAVEFAKSVTRELINKALAKADMDSAKIVQLIRLAEAMK